MKTLKVTPDPLVEKLKKQVEKQKKALVLQLRKKALKLEKKAKKEPKRKAKQQMKYLEAIEWAKAEEEVRKQIVKQVFAPERVEYEVERRQFKDMYLCAEGKQTQRDAQALVFQGRQERLGFQEMDPVEDQRQKKNYQQR